MLKIIVTGPESSGKTTLCKALSEHYNLPFTKEFAREYLTDLGKNYLQEDLLKIAVGQLKSEQNTQLLDTDLITIKIWSEYKYGNCDKWILEQIEKQKTEKVDTSRTNPKQNTKTTRKGTENADTSAKKPKRKKRKTRLKRSSYITAPY